MSLDSEQKVFRDKQEKELEKAIAELKRSSLSTKREVIQVSELYNDKHSGDVLTVAQQKQLKKDVGVKTVAMLVAEQEIMNKLFGEVIDVINTGYAYSYSKVSDSYISYANLTKAQKKLIKEDKIAGKTYIQRLKFHSDNLTDKTAAIIQNGIRNGLSNQQIAKGITDEMGINYSKSLTIARTETGRIGSMMAEQAGDNAASKGLVFTKVWRHYASTEPREEHSAMDGQRVKQGEVFTYPNGATAQYPRLSGVASEDINCHCEAIEEFEGFESKERRQETEIVKIGSYDSYMRAR